MTMIVAMCRDVMVMMLMVMVVMFVAMVMMSKTLPCRGLFRGNYGKDKQLPPQMTSTTLLPWSKRMGEEKNEQGQKQRQNQITNAKYCKYCKNCCIQLIGHC